MDMMLLKTGKENDLKKYHLKWIGQRKFDGCRAWVFCVGSDIRIKGRSGSDYTNKFPEIIDDLKGLNLNCILDGELICNTFDEVASRVHTENKLKSKLLVNKYPAKLMIFDLVRKGIYIERFRELLLLFKNHTLKNVSIVDSSVDLIKLWERAKSENWEGIVIKNPNASYEMKRSYNVLKIKFEKFKDIDFVSYEINNAGIRCESEDGIAIQITGSNSIPVKSSIDELGKCRVEVKYLNETKNKKLRMPVFSKIK